LVPLVSAQRALHAAVAGGAGTRPLGAGTLDALIPYCTAPINN
jgi:hypothetical protein